MIEAVTTLAVKAVAAKSASQSAASFVSSTPEFTPPEMGGLKIRMDVQLDRAILEYRSGEGEVLRRYPTESQIQAFKRSLDASSGMKTAAPVKQEVEYKEVSAAPAETGTAEVVAADTGVTDKPSASVVV